MGKKETKGELVLYQPDGTLKLEVYLEDETIWLTQEQIATLFGVDRTVVSKHLKNILQSGELLESSICAIFAHMGSNGKQIELIPLTQPNLGFGLMAFSKIIYFVAMP